MPNAKGTVVVEAVKTLLARRDQAAAALPPKLRRYLDEKVVLASWYPLEDYIELLRVMSRIGAGGKISPCEQMGRDAAKSHMQGTYSRLAKSSDRKAAMTLASSMYDSGEMRVVEREPGRAVMELVGFAIPSREVCETFTGYQAERMALLGFEDISVKHSRCRALGAPNCFWELTWKGRARDEG
jgi:hypothetical protein